MYRLSLFLIIGCSLCGCTNYKPNKLRIAAGSSYIPFAQSLQVLWKQELGLDVELVASGGSVKNCQDLVDGKAEFALAQNDLPIKELTSTACIRSVLSLFKQMLFIIYRDDIRASSLQELVSGRHLCLGVPHSANEHLAEALLYSSGIEENQFHRVEPANPQANILSDSIDVSFIVTAFTGSQITTMLTQQHGQLFSLDDIERFNKGSVADGFCLRYFHAQPYIIPRHAYGVLPEQACLTVAVENLLLCRSDLDPYLVHAMVKVIVEHRQQLANTNAALASITDKFDRSSFAFPLHDGARMYVERNEPAFIERYASVFGLILSLAAGAIGAGSGVMQWNKRRKKNRIDVYYLELLAIREQARVYTNAEQCRQALVTVEAIEVRAFRQLVAEKLTADESFRIFTDLMRQTIETIQTKAKEISL